MSADVMSGAAAAQWAELSDALLAGLVHMLNNRVTALSVCAELAVMGDEEMITGGVLTTEMQRLQRASAMIGLLPSRPHQPEALELRPVLDDAIALHAHHPRTRLVACDVAMDPAMQPVRAPRWALLRLMLVLVDSAKDAAAESANRAAIRLTSDERTASVRIITASDGGPYGAAMAELCDAQLTRDGDELVLSMPTLLLLRQRKRDARTED
jgi:C4-dicarboxylate-specific signal transduction histidine kinase